MEIAEMTVVIMKKLSEGVVARYIGVDHAKRRWYHIVMNKVFDKISNSI